MLTTSSDDRAKFERPRPTEPADIRQIVRGILAVQAQYAAADRGRLERGTHAKGVCARATFEVFDVASLIPDARLAGRLARGIFAHPGTYPATVRFANGASHIQRDQTGDVRALSFSIDVPPGVVGASVTRLDFAMNDATTFPINDAHAFATLMRVAAAPSKWAKAKAVWNLPLRDALGLGVTAIRGAIQTRRGLRPYQSLRYWSTVPFRHGGNEAIKYSATPSPSNPAQALSSGPNCLREELVRHLTQDAQMATFDVGLQLLDADRLTHWGRARDVSYWIENASIEWKESESAFFTVGRLTLVRDSVLSPEASEAMYIDVTKYAAPNGEPLGSINRARRSAESASREARQSGISEVPAEIPLKRTWPSRLLRWAVIAAVLLLVARVGGGWWYNRGAAAYLPANEPQGTIGYLNQGWSEAERDLYYYTPQGASLHELPYSWFISLERPFSRMRFADPEHMRQLRFIVDPYPSRANPDRLPVGFTKRYDGAAQDYVLDITCAACHTGQLNVRQPDGQMVELRVDGGSAMNAVSDVKRGSFPVELLTSFGVTLADPFKFNRFANNVLGSGATWSQKRTLWTNLLASARALSRNARGAANPSLYPTQEGFGRTDALARIANTVFGDHIDPRNYHTGDGPVNFPYLWNIWKFDWVQYNASVSQPMARNVGEVMGTGATYLLVDDYGRPVPPSERYRTSIQFENLHWIESTLQSLKPPAWPERLLGPIDHDKAAKGKALFMENCYECHGPWVADDLTKKAMSPLRGTDDPMWQIWWKAADAMGTDPNAALNFVRNRVDISRSGLQAADVARRLRQELDKKATRTQELIAGLTRRIAETKTANRPTSDLEKALSAAQGDASATAEGIKSLGQLDLRSVSSGEGLTIFGTMIRDRYYADRGYSPQAQACFNGFDTLDLPQTVPGYKPRPLKGVWATPPFLHNGSVPTVYDLLSPPDKRPVKFYVGNREFDPKKLGYVTTRPADAGGFIYDTRLSGNHNTGHGFIADPKTPMKDYPAGVIGRLLTDEERYAIIEYLKVGPDEEPTAANRVPPDCFKLLNGGSGQPAAATSSATAESY
jgi:hypothetical protein